MVVVVEAVSAVQLIVIMLLSPLMLNRFRGCGWLWRMRDPRKQVRSLSGLPFWSAASPPRAVRRHRYLIGSRFLMITHFPATLFRSFIFYTESRRNLALMIAFLLLPAGRVGIEEQ